MAGVTEHSIVGPAGFLQLVAELPSGRPSSLAVICHPHPLHGGTLDNKVVHQLARSFCGLGAVSVRFNFRGVGSSEGRYDEGRGELDDLIAVVEWARQRWSGLSLWLAGFSFGGFIALEGASLTRPEWLVTVAPAVNHFPVASSLLPELRWLLIQGDQDDIVPAEQVLKWLNNIEHKPQLVMLEGAGHFFHGRLNDLRQVIESVGRELVPVAGG